ncbi:MULTISPECIES: hypothetical protein [unclassified Streptomyces]|nr:hypothetical protein [Streptomyces sp. A1136]
MATLALLADRAASVESAISRATGPREPVAHPAGRHVVRPDGPGRP